MMSFFDRQGIPEALLRRREEVEEASKGSYRREVSGIRRLGRLFRRDRSGWRGQGKCEASSSSVDRFEEEGSRMTRKC